MKRFTFTNPQKLAVLHDGRTRVFFDETVAEETVETIPEGGKKPVSETHTVYIYRAADIPAGEPADKGAVVNAIIRAQYSQDAVEAIFRHKLAGESSAEFDEFNAFAEAAKARAAEILG